MVLGFKDQFKEKILDGSKIHTIREDKNNRWKAGNSIQFSTGVRTKNQNKFKEGTCISVQKIEIKHHKNSVFLFIDGKEKGAVWYDGAFNKIMSCDGVFWGLAMRDGFDSMYEFLQWFNEDFTGNLIHWTNETY